MRLRTHEQIHRPEGLQSDLLDVADLELAAAYTSAREEVVDRNAATPAGRAALLALRRPFHGPEHGAVRRPGNENARFVAADVLAQCLEVIRAKAPTCYPQR